MTPISDPLFNVTCYAVAGDLIVYSGKPIRPGARTGNFLQIPDWGQGQSMH